jgi:diguanylate cyclase (GGDEF)-like protein
VLAGLKCVAARLGPRASDEVLLHAAGVFRSNVRASDVIGRVGGDAFGMLLRGANAAGATVLAQNLHRVLREQPARTSGGELVQLDVNIGTAVFPRDGATGAELAQAAERGLRRRERA